MTDDLPAGLLLDVQGPIATITPYTTIAGG